MWKPKNKEQQKGYYQPWLNLDLILYTSIEAGFIALRDDKSISGEELNEKDLDRVTEIFTKGMAFGFDKSIENLSSNLKNFASEARVKL